MPRVSAEARSAAGWREGARHPQPPKHLSKDEREVWREVVECRPVDFFQPGSLHLLELFCVQMVEFRAVRARYGSLPTGERSAILDYVGTCTKLSSSLAQLAQKLRLSIQSALRTESRKLDEKEPKVDTLIGGIHMPRGKSELN